jgi:hypothetical protein
MYIICRERVLSCNVHSLREEGVCAFVNPWWVPELDIVLTNGIMEGNVKIIFLPSQMTISNLVLLLG